MRICLDPGHTGMSDPGAVGPGGTTEAAVNMEVCRQLQEVLVAAGHEVMLTRDGPDDSVDDLYMRVAMAEQWAADVFISVHCNSFSDYRAHGFEVWTMRGQDSSDILATNIIDRMKAAFPGLSLRADMSDGDEDKEAGFAVLKGPFPSVLVELAFISNPVEEGMLADPVQQRLFAEAIAGGIKTWAG
jgi:N-acetylmuramoyl-L-alanine amidase